MRSDTNPATCAAMPRGRLNLNTSINLVATARNGCPSVQSACVTSLFALCLALWRRTRGTFDEGLSNPRFKMHTFVRVDYLC